MNICGIASIFTYGFNDTLINFKNAEINYISLCDYETLLPEAINQNILKSDDLSILMQWRENPSIWKK
jgi:orotate phosphoribosyltransferase